MTGVSSECYGLIGEDESDSPLVDDEHRRLKNRGGLTGEGEGIKDLICRGITPGTWR